MLGRMGRSTDSKFQTRAVVVVASTSLRKHVCSICERTAWAEVVLVVHTELVAPLSSALVETRNSAARSDRMLTSPWRAASSLSSSSSAAAQWMSIESTRAVSSTAPSSTVASAPNSGDLRSSTGGMMFSTASTDAWTFKRAEIASAK